MQKSTHKETNIPLAPARGRMRYWDWDAEIMR